MQRKKVSRYLEGYPYALGNLNRLLDRIDYDPSVENRIRRAEEKLKEIQETILSVEDDRYRTLLELRYIEGRSLEEIGEVMSYSYSRIAKLHGFALDAVVLPDNKRNDRV